MTDYIGADPELLGMAIDLLKAEIKDLRAACSQKQEIIDADKELFVKLQEENAALREGLRKLEWADRNQFGEGASCRACGAWKNEGKGHRLDCWLAKLLEGK